MLKEKDVELSLISLFEDLKNIEDIKIAISNIFSDYQTLINNFEGYFDKKSEQDVKRALEINWDYYDKVLSKNEKYKNIVDNNLSSLKDAIKSNDDKLIKIENHNDELKIQSEIIIDNRDIDIKKEIIDANKRLENLIVAANSEIEFIKQAYIENSDKYINSRDIELEVLASEYQIKLENLRQKMRDRNQIYEQQVARNRQIREQYVLNHSEKYQDIKNLHTSFSIYYNSRIDEISKKYREEVKFFNDEYSAKISILMDQVTELETEIFSKELETKNLIQEKSESLKLPFQEAKDEYDQELRNLVAQHNDDLDNLANDFKIFEDEMNQKIEKHYEVFRESDQSRDSHQQLQYLIRPIQKTIKDEQKAHLLKLKNLISEHRKSTKNLYNDFVLKKLKLDLDFISFEYETSIKNNNFFEANSLKIHLINLEVEKLEEEKNQKIWMLNNAYNQEISYIERILALGSERQEFMIQDQDGNNSFALAASQFNNEIVKTSFEIDTENINLQIKILKIVYLNNVKKVTSKYQLLIQEEMVKRDTIIKQYECEIDIERENLKLVRLQFNFEYDLLRLKTEYELDVELVKNDQKTSKLKYFLNLTKIKLDDINKKYEATLEFEIAEAKASRNLDMYLIDAEKADRYYISLLDALLLHHKKIDEITKIMKSSYSHPDFSMTRFYHLIDLVCRLLPSVEEESNIIISHFKDLTDIEITKKIDELTGYQHRNKLQTILDQNASSEELVKFDIDQLIEDRDVLNSELVYIEQLLHRDNIQISQLYRYIQILKNENKDLDTYDELIKLKVELAKLKNQIKQSERLKRQIEKQISFKNNQILSYEDRIKKIKKSYNRQKRRLNNQVKREARAYYKEKNRNLKQFTNLTKIIEKYVHSLSRNLNSLKANLTRTMNAIDIFSNNNEDYCSQLINQLFKSLNIFRNINLRIYYNQQHDQKNISTGFNSSYRILVDSLNRNYRNNFLKEKRKNNEQKRAYDQNFLKLQQKYDLEVLKATKTFESRTNAIGIQLKAYDDEFRNIFIQGNNYIKTIKTNQSELEQELDTNTTTLTKKHTEEFTTFNNKKKSLLKDLATKHYQLFNSTVDRSLKYRDNYLETKRDIEETLKLYYKQNQEAIRHKASEHRRYLHNKKRQERYEQTYSRRKLQSKNRRVDQRYLTNLKEIHSK